MADIEVTDKRASSMSISRAAANLKARGFALPNSPVMARREVQATQAAVENRSLTASMRRTGANVQMALPKVREPMSSLKDKGIPFDTTKPKELKEIRRWCNTPDAPVWMADYTFKNIGDIAPGEQVIGWTTDEKKFGSGRRQLVPSTVLAVNRREAPEIVRITFESGRTVQCTPDHEWLRYYIPGKNGKCYGGKRVEGDYAPLEVGSVARHVITATKPLSDPKQVEAAFYLAGIIDGEGSWRDRSITICQSETVNPAICSRIEQSLNILGLEYVKGKSSRSVGRQGSDVTTWTLRSKSAKTRQSIVDIFNWTHPEKMTQERMDSALLSSNFGEADRVVSVESLGAGEVVSMQTTTGNYTAWGFASKNCRLFYSTHDLIPLLIDIYSKFPIVGMEFVSKDPLIKDFYESMFLDSLDYDTFLQDLGREYFISGEVNSLAHFDETLGIWTAEEILNPDTLSVSKSMFVTRERVQLVVKDLVETLRDGASAGAEDGPTRSEQLEKRYEYQQLLENYPEIIEAAATEDGLDISDALISRIVNKVQPWDLRGTPHLLRSFRTLLMEESLNAAQDAVADRLYSPFILATLGIPNLGDGEPWIPDQGDLDNARDDMQAALAADFRLMVHNFGLDIKSVFGRESVPRFDTDYARIDKKLMQAWGIGEALISGGTSQTYAGSALNREFVTQIMVTFQKAIKKHMRKRCEVIAEAQGHYDYELTGGVRKPIFREIVEEDEEGNVYTRKVPKLLVPEVKFQSLNLRDEAQERSFLQALRAQGVPISDMTLAVNIPIEFVDELEKQSEEKVQKLIAESQAMQKAYQLAKAQGLPIPTEVARYYAAGIQLEKEIADSEIQKEKATTLENTGELPGTPGAAGAPGAVPGGLPGAVPGAPTPPGAGGPPTPPGGGGSGENNNQGLSEGGERGGSGNAFGVDLDNGISDDQLDNSKPEGDGGDKADSNVIPLRSLPQRNRTRPEESDEQRANSPRKSGKFDNPSSYGSARRVDERSIETALARLSSSAQTVRDLVANDEFFVSLTRQSHADQIRADIDTIYHGVHVATDGTAALAIKDESAQESFEVLCEMLDQYEDAYGFRPEW